MAAESKPRVLILGGVGFIGRELVTHLAENELVSHIRVADKQMPEVAYLSERQLAVFHNEDLVEYVQVRHCARSTGRKAQRRACARLTDRARRSAIFPATTTSRAAPSSPTAAASTTLSTSLAKRGAATTRRCTRRRW